MSSRVDTLNRYLVGDGFLSTIPKKDDWFYRLAGLCSHSSWPLKPKNWRPYTIQPQPSEVLSQDDPPPVAVYPQIRDDKVANGEDADPKQLLFRPKTCLPAPVFQQTYRIWKGTMDMNLQFRKIRRRHTIYIQPLDDFPPFLSDFTFQRGTGIFCLLQEFLGIFFLGINVDLLSPISTADWKVTSRQHRLTGQKQLLVDDLHKGLSTTMPRDGQAILGITWTDLYPSEDLNFVLGQASVILRSAVMCFGRFETKLYATGSIPDPITAVDAGLIYKMIKVVAHEMCHIFCLSHCVFYDCLMNESKSVSEAVSQPLFLCPVCLRKLQKVCRFDITERYVKMLEFLESLGPNYSSENTDCSIAWLKRCILWMQGSRGIERNFTNKNRLSR